MVWICFESETSLMFIFYSFHFLTATTTTTMSSMTTILSCDASNSDYGCCTSSNPCGLGEGDCDSDSECNGDLICGLDNCQSLDSGWAYSDIDCCIEGK